MAASFGRSRRSSDARITRRRSGNEVSSLLRSQFVSHSLDLDLHPTTRGTGFSNTCTHRRHTTFVRSPASTSFPRLLPAIELSTRQFKGIPGAASRERSRRVEWSGDGPVIGIRTVPARSRWQRCCANGELVPERVRMESTIPTMTADQSALAPHTYYAHGYTDAL